MASKARVGLSAAKPSVSSSYTRIRATFSAGKAVAAITINRPALAAGRVNAVLATQATIPAALLKWVSIVLSVDVDTIGRNPILKDVFAVLDSVNVQAEKRIQESLATSEDTFLLIFKKGNLEPLHTSETKKFDISKPLSDRVSATDDFYGSANVDDDETMIFAKALPAEFQHVSDRTVVVAGKGLAEALHTADQFGPFVIGKLRSDGVSTSEVRSVSFSKKLSDTTHAGDEFNAVALTDDGEVMVFGKTLADSFTQSDFASVSAGKGLSESTSSSDELLPFVLGKGIADTPATSETLTRSSSKPLADSFSQSDAAAVGVSKAPFNERRFATDGPAADVTYAVYGYFGEDYVYEYFPAKDFFKGRAETIATLDTVAIATVFNRSFADTFTRTDIRVFSLSKSFSETLGKSDAYVIGLTKFAGDLSYTSDYKSYNFSKSLAESLHATDDFYGVANADDDETMYFAKMVVDALSSSDARTQAFSKRLNDASSTSELRIVDLQKPLSDSVSKSDLIVKGYSKISSDSVGKSDAAVLANGKAIADSLAKSDTVANLVGKYLSDSVAKSDLQSKDFAKARSDSAATADTRTYAYSKSLSDYVQSTDDFYGVANADDDETMLFGKSVADSVLKSDLSIKDFSKFISDSVSKSDVAYKGLSKPFADTFSKSDTTTLTPNKGLSESLATSETRVYAIAKALSDTATKSDSISKSNQKPLSDSFASSDASSKSFGKAVNETQTTSDSKTFSLTRTFADTVHPTDDFYGVANADDDEVMSLTKAIADGVANSDSSTKSAQKLLTDSVNKGDSGSLVWTDYWDVTYTNASSGVYVGNSRTF